MDMRAPVVGASQVERIETDPALQWHPPAQMLRPAPIQSLPTTALHEPLQRSFRFT